VDTRTYCDCSPVMNLSAEHQLASSYALLLADQGGRLDIHRRRAPKMLILHDLVGDRATRADYPI